MTRFSSLRVRNYRLYWFGQVVSQLGSWLSLTAVSWLVLAELDAGPAAVGWVTAAQFLPTLLLGSYAGVLADRSNKRRLLIWTQGALLIIGALMAALVASGAIELWMVMVLQGARGVATAFDNPARQSFVGEMVGPELIPNAVALNSAGFNSMRVIGPAVAGILIAAVGTELCFALNAASFAATIGALLAIRGAELHPQPAVVRAKGQIREGFTYAMHEPVLRAALLTMAVVGTVSMNFTVLVPLLARNTFGTDASTFGLLSTAMGAGSLLGSLRAAGITEPSLVRQAKASLALGVSMLAAAASPTLPLAMVALACAGASVQTFTTTTNSVLQLGSLPHMRGRVLSFYLILFIGTSPFGSPIVGAIAEGSNTRVAFVYGAAGALVGSLIAFRRRAAKPRADTATPLVVR
ncbi:MAG TPA: MFS transporter [Acidimicrobiales bacterium]|nr:MFS transporter [Acidimicrobiales bacterium]